MKKNQLHLCIQPFFLIALFLLWMTACDSQAIQKTDISKTHLGSSECRVIQHELGETCVPLQPQRVIVTDEGALDAVLGIGLQPIAAAESNLAGSRGRQFAGKKIEEIISIGKSSQVNIERMVQLHPDLILGFYFTPENYKLFSQIAPTVKLEAKYLKDGWKDSLREVGEILGKTEQADDALAQYQQRVRQLQKLINEKLGTMEVSASRFYAGLHNPQFDTIFSFSGWILKEVGLSAPRHQLQATTSPDTYSVLVSLERVDLLDADVLFAMLDPGAEENFKKYQKSQLWQLLKVAKNGRVYTVDSGYWYGGNILAANAILDDLYRYLLGAS
ncbi:MAG: iron siderophore-binding protein [Mastigocladus sp. ERB_26_2]